LAHGKNLPFIQIAAMARVKDNIVTQGLSGTVGEMVYKTYAGKTVVTKKPDMSTAKSSEKKQRCNTDFAGAVMYAKAAVKDPAVARKIKLRPGETLYNKCISLYLSKKPLIPLSAMLIKKQPPKKVKQYQLSPRQAKAIKYVQEKGEVTNAIYQQLNNVSKATATRDLQDLVSKKLLNPSGFKGAGASYRLR
jgi:hypothetical protein